MGMGDFSASSFNLGLLALHGPHHVAENVTMAAPLLAFMKSVNSSGDASSVKVIIIQNSFWPNTVGNIGMFMMAVSSSTKCQAWRRLYLVGWWTQEQRLSGMYGRCFGNWWNRGGSGFIRFPFHSKCVMEIVLTVTTWTFVHVPSPESDVSEFTVKSSGSHRTLTWQAKLVRSGRKNNDDPSSPFFTCNCANEKVLRYILTGAPDEEGTGSRSPYGTVDPWEPNGVKLILSTPLSWMTTSLSRRRTTNERAHEPTKVWM